MMKENVLPALVRLAKVENAEIKQDVATALCRLSTSVEFAFDMVDEGLPEALYWLTLEDLLGLNKSVYLRCSVVCRNVVISDDAVRRVSSESTRFSKVLERLSATDDPDLLQHVAMVCLRITGMRESMLAFHRGEILRGTPFSLRKIVYACCSFHRPKHTQDVMLGLTSLAGVRLRYVVPTKISRIHRKADLRD